MGREIERLTALKVQAKDLAPGMYPDGGGLYLRVTREGVRNWVLRYMLNGRPRWMGLGSLALYGLSDARAKALDARRKRHEGIDPIEARRAERARQRLEAAKAITFKECADTYVNAHSAGWKNEKHAAQWPSTLRTYALHAGVAHLDKLLPARSKFHKVEHHAALPYPELPAFLVALRKQDGIAAHALEFLILTAARTGEVIGARWNEINVLDKVWIVPPERMKARREHRVPLSLRALTILREMHELRRDHHTNDFVFPGRKPGLSLSNMAFLMLLRRMGVGHLTGHGFRATFKTWASERTSFQNEIAEAALAHIIGDKVEQAYRRGDLFEKRRRLMGQWAAFCTTEPVQKSQSNVTALRAP